MCVTKAAQTWLLGTSRDTSRGLTPGQVTPGHVGNGLA
jgi:hypothetical protein